METIQDIDTFLSLRKSLLISPAGYGKTYSIVQCVKRAEGKSLILTHTHAGVAAIKNALNNQAIDKQIYQIETITSYAQKYVKAYCNEVFPPITPSEDYWLFVLEKAEQILKNKHIKDVIGSTYKHLFVDEYQDCTILQHKVILALSEILQTHILGDPLQGIMNFNKKDRLVSFYNDDLKEFIKVKELEKPYRWSKEGNNEVLGEYLKKIRNTLLKNIENDEHNNIDLNDNPNKAFCLIQTEGNAYSYDEISKNTNKYNKDKNKNFTYQELLRRIIQNNKNNPSLESLLIISNTPYNPKKTSVQIRAELKSRLYSPELNLLEAIDDESFYEVAKSADKVICDGLKNNLKILRDDFLLKIFVSSNTEMKKWIKDSYELVHKTKKSEILIYQNLLKYIEDLKKHPNGVILSKIVQLFYKDIGLKCSRTDFYNCIQNALLNTDENKTVYDTMTAQRNKLRRVGRKVIGKCLGTVALTKGLEFDTVIILDAHNFKSSKDLYVAMTRACKNLIIFSQKTILEPYNKRKSPR